MKKSHQIKQMSPAPIAALCQACINWKHYIHFGQIALDANTGELETESIKRN